MATALAATRSSTIPLAQRKYDIAILVTCIAFVFTTFFPDITVVLDIDLVNFEATRADPPAWPPMWILEPLVEYAHACDLLFLHSPPYYDAMMWGDIFLTGPFYIAAFYAFLRGRNWIRIPGFIYGAHVLSYAPIMINEHLYGAYASPNPTLVLAFYTPYWLFGLLLMIRLWRHRPFDVAN